MADKIQSFGKTKLIDTGSVTKIECDGTVRMVIDHSSGNITAGTTSGTGVSMIIANEVNVSPTAGVSEKFYVEGDSRLKGRTYQDGVFTLVEQGANTNPSGGSSCLIYMKGDKLVISYDHSGTAKYRTLDLTSTDATWAYTTSAP